MAPLPLPLTNVSSVNLSLSNNPTTPFQTGTQTQWGPDSIGTIVFGVLMFSLGLVALWQGRQRAMQHEHDTEQGNTIYRQERTVNAADSVPMSDMPRGVESEGIRSQDGEEQRCKQSSKVEVNEYASKEEDNEEGGGEVQVGQLQGDESHAGEEFEPKRGKNTRTDTDWTLVGSDDEDEAKGKNDED